MSTRLASFPFARQNQIPAGADTFRLTLNAGTPVVISAPSEDRAYILLRNISNSKIRYFYNTSDFANGMVLNPGDTARIVNRQEVSVQIESGSGDICYDIGIG